MKKRTVVALVFAVLLTASTYAQTPGFFKLVMIGTPKMIQAAIDQGADVNARSPNGGTALMVAAPRSIKNPFSVSMGRPIDNCQNLPNSWSTRIPK